MAQDLRALTRHGWPHKLSNGDRAVEGAKSLKADPSRSVLVIEDDPEVASGLVEFFEEEGWDVESASTVKEGRSKLVQRVFDLLVADYLLPDANVLTLFDDVQLRSPLTKILVITGVRDIEVVAQSFKKGAGDFVSKPFLLTELQKRIHALMEEGCLEAQREREMNDVKPSRPISIVGQSPALLKVFQLIDLVADKNATVLVTGESGTGKELVASAIHSQSSRKAKPLVAINCAAIPENLLEDELFGHVRGAYTDARTDRKGKFEKADGGTLFLDEIGDMPMSLQVKLLRVLEQNTFQKLGSNKTIRVDVRIVVATNCDLMEKVKRGEFRKDLFYRLKVVPIQLPPLRERKEDLPLLATHFLETFSDSNRLTQRRLSPGALKRLMQHPWPGNIRELRNVLELACVLSGPKRTILEVDDFATLDDETLSEFTSSQPAKQGHVLPMEGIDLKQFIQELEKTLILESLRRTEGNKQKAARLLGLKRTTLVAKLRRMNGSTQTDQTSTLPPDWHDRNTLLGSRSD